MNDESKEVLRQVDDRIRGKSEAIAGALDELRLTVGDDAPAFVEETGDRVRVYVVASGMLHYLCGTADSGTPSAGHPRASACHYCAAPITGRARWTLSVSVSDEGGESKQAAREWKFWLGHRGESEPIPLEVRTGPPQQEATKRGPELAAFARELMATITVARRGRPSNPSA